MVIIIIKILRTMFYFSKKKKMENFQLDAKLRFLMGIFSFSMPRMKAQKRSKLHVFSLVTNSISEQKMQAKTC